MKTKGILIALVLLLTSISASAQMAAAKKVEPKIKLNQTINASAEQVWKYISDPANYKEFSGAKLCKCYEGRVENAIMYLTIGGKPEREQRITTIDDKRMKINFYVEKSSYSPDPIAYGFTVSKDGDKAKVQISMNMSDADYTAQTRKDLETEYANVFAGLKKKFK